MESLATQASQCSLLTRLDHSLDALPTQPRQQHPPLLHQHQPQGQLSPIHSEQAPRVNTTYTQALCLPPLTSAAATQNKPVQRAPRVHRVKATQAALQAAPGHHHAQAALRCAYPPAVLVLLPPLQVMHITCSWKRAPTANGVTPQLPCMTTAPHRGRPIASFPVSPIACTALGKLRD
jgi:hypothetical protein